MNNGIPTTQTVSHLAVASISPTVIYAGVRNLDNSFYRSDNGGESWQGLPRIHVYPMTGLAVNPVTPTIAFAGFSTWDVPTFGGEVFRSINGGLNWAQVLPYGTLAYSIVVDPENPKVVYLASSTSNMLKSVDAGNNWVSINNGLPPISLSINQILLNPTDTSIVTITTSNGLYRSSDGGNNWINIGSGLPTPWLSSIAYVPGNPEILFATPVEGDNYFGIYQSLDDGKSWQHFAQIPLNEQPIKVAVEVGSKTNLFVLFEDANNENGRFWKLGLP